MRQAIKYGTLSSAALLAALAAGQAAPAAAQTAAPAAGAAIEEVVVTARRREENAQTVPITVIALGAEQLERRQITATTDLPRMAPGLTVDVGNNKLSTVQIGIRGQRMNQVFSTQDPPTAFYFADALIMPVQGLNSAFYDLQSVQVLKGPQGTLFGRNTTGGAVVVTPARPTHDFEGYARGKVGNLGSYALEGVVNAPVSDSLALRGSMKYEKKGGYQTYVAPSPGGRKPGEDKSLDLRVSALWDPTDSFSNYSILYYARDRNGTVASSLVAINPLSPAGAFNGTGAKAAFPNVYNDFQPVAGRDPYDVASNIPQFDNNEAKGAINTSTLKVGAVTLKNIFSYRLVDNESKWNFAGTRAPILLSYQNAHHKIFSDEFQVAGTAMDGRLDLLAGVYYFNWKGFDLQSAVAFYGPPVAANASTFLTYVGNTSAAAYLSGKFKLTDELTLSGGLRYTRDKREVDWKTRAFDLWGDVGVPFVPGCNLRDDNNNSLPLSACDIAKSATFSEPTWDISLNYEFQPGSMVYATQRRGYRSGGFNSRAVTVLQRIAFEPEKVMDYEVGLKSDFNVGDWAVRLNASAYHDSYKGLQRAVSLVLGSTVTGSVFNAANAKVDGLELQTIVRPTSDLTLSATYAYTKPKYKQFDAVVGGVLRDFSDRDLTGVPRNSATATVEYRLPVDAAHGEVNLLVNYSFASGVYLSDLYQSKQQLSFQYTPAQLGLIADNTIFKTKSYSLFDASVSWKNVEGQPVDLTFYMRNVLDKRYAVGGISLYESLGVTQVQFGPPRTFGVEATYRFK